VGLAALRQPVARHFQGYAKWPAEKKLKVRDALWKSPDLIEAYLEANPEALSSEEVEIVRNLEEVHQG
jgi:hypothetical protein